MAHAVLPMPADATLAEPAFALVQREEAAIRRVILRYVRDAAAADDVFQEVSLKILRRVDTVRDPASLRGWIYQLARNASLDWLRREDRRPVRPGEPGEEQSASGEQGASPLAPLLSAERIAAVHRALAELPASQREAIRLRLQEGLDHEQIASRLGISRGAVEVRLCRGRTALKERLDQILGGEL